MTLLLRRSDLERLLAVDACLATLRSGFARQAGEIPPSRTRTELPGPGTATALLPGLVEGIPAYTVKVNAKFPDARPALRGVVCLHDLASGELLAVLDSATVTAWRTGLAAALGTHLLARPGDTQLGVIGAGAQAELVVRGLAECREIERLVVHDIDEGRARAFAGGQGLVAARPAEVAERCSVVVLATWSQTPLLRSENVRPGAHFTSLGADEPGKAELSAGLLSAARVVVDDVVLASAGGALGNVGLGPESAAGTLAEVVSGRIPGRTREEEVTVYAPIGLPWQDLALAWHAYRAALLSGTGTSFDWLG